MTALDRFQGCLLGLAVGDCLGGPVEGLSSQEIDTRYGRLTEMVGGGWLDLSPGEHTDDTEMMLCLARSVVECGGFDPEDVARRFVAWLASEPKDIGNITRLALEALRRGTPWQESGRGAHQLLGGMSAGNGSIMRCAPLGLLHFRHPGRLVRDSLASAIITHWDTRAGWATVALNRGIVALLQGRRPVLLEEMVKGIEDAEVQEAISGVPGLAQGEVPTSGYVLDTLQAAVWSFLQAATLEEAVITAVNLGGDADTIGAVCGALAGAYFGLAAIPKRWRDTVRAKREVLTLADGIWRLAQA